MQIKKAVITAAAKRQRTLPMQTLIDEHGMERSVLSLIVRQAVQAGIHDVCIVVWPGDEEAYAELLSDDAAKLTFVQQTDARGYGHAVSCAESFVDGEPFLHLVGDHIYVGNSATSCAERLVRAAEIASCSISAVQMTRESLLHQYGAVGGQPVHGENGFYRVETVLEKPTATEAEQQLIIPGLRSGQYLCFFGMHVLTPTIFTVLSEMLRVRHGNVSLSAALAELAHREQYLAMVQSGRRFDVGVKYGLFAAQLALGINGTEREDVLAQLVDVLAMREMSKQDGGIPA